MARYEMLTRSGYNFYDMSSLLQKSIRRGDYERAGFAAYQLCDKYRKYLWKRLLIISAEDCYGIITKEIVGLKLADDETGKKEHIFISKAIVLLCQALKNRDACFFACNYMSDDELLKPESIECKKGIDECRLPEDTIPDWVFDVHTLRGKIRGKTIDDMIRDEQEALSPKQIGLFDNEGWDLFLNREGAR